MTDTNEQSKGLWHNIRAKQKRGEPPARKGSDAYNKAVSSAKKINNMDEITIDNASAIKLLEAIKKCHCQTQMLEESEYRGRKVQLNKPTRGDVKKFKVYVKKGDKVVKVNFGDPNMRIKKSNPKRRKSFRARHNCDNPGPKHKARYWSCRKW